MVDVGKRGRKCTVCTHPVRRDIERALVRGMPFEVAGLMFQVSPDALRRHFWRHLLKCEPSEEIREMVFRVAELFNEVVVVK